VIGLGEGVMLLGFVKKNFQHELTAQAGKCEAHPLDFPV